MKKGSSILAAASLVGTIVGAGVFAIPYVVAKSGVLTSLFYFILLGWLVLLLHLFYGEIVLRTEGRHQLTGYARKYLGSSAKKIILAMTVLGAIGTLLVYVILGGEFLKIILPFNLPAWQWASIFWLFLSIFVFLGIKSIAPLELVMDLGIFFIFLLVFIFCLPQVDFNNYTLFQPSYFFLPFGILLFSLLGWHSIPEIMDVLEKKNHLKKIIIVSVLLCTVLYLFFGFLTAGVSGGKTTDHAFEGLEPFLGNRIIILGACLGFLAVATSFLITANYLKNIFRYDCSLSYFLAFCLAIFLPLFLFLLGFRAFIPVISAVGAFVGLAEGAAIALIFLKAKKQGDRTPEYSLKVSDFVVCLIIFVLVSGALIEATRYFY